jgi:hypothetical protein
LHTVSRGTSWLCPLAEWCQKRSTSRAAAASSGPFQHGTWCQMPRVATDGVHCHRQCRASPGVGRGTLGRSSLEPLAGAYPSRPWPDALALTAVTASGDDTVPGSLVEDGCMIGDRWGVSESETLRSYPCDDFVAAPTMQAWRGVRIEAPAEAIWPWVSQVGLAPYSYDWIDNRGHRSPRHLVGLPEPQAGVGSPQLAGVNWAGSSRSIPARS